MPYDKTEFDIIYQGDSKGLKVIRDYWVSIGKPMYDSQKTFQENMRTVYQKFKIWPEPLFDKNLIQTTLLDYEEEGEMEDFFEFQRKLEQHPPDKKSSKEEPDEYEFDDEIPF